MTRNELIQVLIAQRAFVIDSIDPFSFTDDKGASCRARQLRPLSGRDLTNLCQANQGRSEGLPLYAQVEKGGIPILPESQQYIEYLWSDESHRSKDVTVTQIDFSGQDLTGVDLQGADMRGANLRNAVLWETRLQRTNLWKANLEGTKLWRANFDSTTQFEGVDWGDFRLGEENDGLFDEATSTYRRLMIWHREKGLFAKEERFHYREWASWRKSLKKQGRYPRFVWYSTLDWMFGYGISYWKVIRTVIIVVAGFALIYFLAGLYQQRDVLALLKSFYFSAVSFTAIGYGAWISTTGSDLGWPKYIGAAEAFVGVFLLALFLTTFTRRWTR